MVFLDTWSGFCSARETFMCCAMICIFTIDRSCPHGNLWFLWHMIAIVFRAWDFFVLCDGRYTILSEVHWFSPHLPWYFRLKVYYMFESALCFFPAFVHKLQSFFRCDIWLCVIFIGSTDSVFIPKVFDSIAILFRAWDFRVLCNDLHLWYW